MRRLARSLWSKGSPGPGRPRCSLPAVPIGTRLPPSRPRGRHSRAWAGGWGEGKSRPCLPPVPLARPHEEAHQQGRFRDLKAVTVNRPPAPVPTAWSKALQGGQLLRGPLT